MSGKKGKMKESCNNCAHMQYDYCASHSTVALCTLGMTSNANTLFHTPIPSVYTMTCINWKEKKE